MILFFIFHMQNRLKKLFIFALFVPVCFTFAASTTSDKRGLYGGQPTEVLDTVVGKANETNPYQETSLNEINSDSPTYDSDYKIANTLDWLRTHIGTYLQWVVYIGLTVAVILLIYNGFLMVTHTITKSGDFAKMKKNVMYIAIYFIPIYSYETFSLRSKICDYPSSFCYDSVWFSYICYSANI